jgi:hypothetical protein
MAAIPLENVGYRTGNLMASGVDADALGTPRNLIIPRYGKMADGCIQEVCPWN